MATKSDSSSKMATAGNGENTGPKDANSAPLPEGSENTIKVICLGDSAVGKSKLVERFLMDDYEPHQQSTYALTLFRHKCKIDTSEGKKEEVEVDFWDTAGQERFENMHPSYYFDAHACLLVFDSTRKITYKNLSKWYKELRQFRENIPVIVCANKIDVDFSITQKTFGFAKKQGLEFFFVSAADGTNVVKVFTEIIKKGWHYKHNSDDFVDQVNALLAEYRDDDEP